MTVDQVILVEGEGQRFWQISDESVQFGFYLATIDGLETYNGGFGSGIHFWSKVPENEWTDEEKSYYSDFEFEDYHDHG